MGCCWSSDSGKQLPRCQGVSNITTYPVHRSKTDVQTHVQTAGWASLWPYSAAFAIRHGVDHVFISMFHGNGGKDEAAAMCRELVYEVFQNCCRRSGGVENALRQTFEELDNQFFNSKNLSDQVKANTGATGIILYLDTASQKWYLASLGNATGVLGRVRGAFMVQAAEGVHMVPHEVASENERVRCGLYQEKEITASVGDGRFKTAYFAGVHSKTSKKPTEFVRPTVTNVPVITSDKLTEHDQHIVLGTHGFWTLVTAQEAASWLHLTAKEDMLAEAEECERKLRLQGSGSAMAAGADASGGQEEQQMAHTQGSNKAHQLVLYAMSKVGDTLTRKLKPQRPLSVADLEKMPFMADKSGVRRNQGVSKASFWSQQPYLRRDVHGDVTAVVVSLRWPSTSLTPALWLAATSHHRLQVTPSESNLQALRRWRLVKAACEFHRIRRRLLLRRWWELCSLVLRQGTKQARFMEELIWRQQQMAVQVTPALRVLAPDGTPLDCDAATPPPPGSFSGSRRPRQQSRPPRRPDSQQQGGLADVTNVVPQPAAGGWQAGKVMGTPPVLSRQLARTPPVKSHLSTAWGKHE